MSRRQDLLRKQVLATLFASVVQSIVVTNLEAATAGPDIRFTFSGQGAAGTIGNISFDNAEFEIFAFASTQDAEVYFPGSPFGWKVEHLSASIALENVGNAIFAETTTTFVNNSTTVIGFSRDFEQFQGADLLVLDCTIDCGSWDLTDSFGPFVTPTVFVLQNQFINVATTLGPLTMTSNALGGRFEARSGVVLPLLSKSLKSGDLTLPLLNERQSIGIKICVRTAAVATFRSSSPLFG